jgi:sterol desaturase/sphingolipid hydroxylase (fatty acid hydroxylase superfamily)
MGLARSGSPLLKHERVTLEARSDEAVMSSLPLEVIEMFGQTIAKVVPITIVLALVFSVLSYFWACNPAAPWWRKREIVTDVCYWFFVPLITRVVRIGLLVVGAAAVFNIHDADELIAFYDNGHGPLSELPLWVQAAIFLILSDFMLYWLHRMYHGGGFWKYHAIHHSSEDLEWISAARFHPVNLFLGTVAVDVILLMAGISPNIMLWVGPFTTFHSAFVHANLNWTLGPFKYVLATPVFHRWHHTSQEEGGNTNFAGTFPVWDILFGTFRMPEGKLPDNYGVHDQAIPSEIGGQLAYPFRQ